MARVPYLDKSDLAPENHDLLKRMITLHRALVHSPNAARAFGGLGQFIRYKSRLDPRLRELAILQVGWLARAPYEWSHHLKIGREFGVTTEDIQRVSKAYLRPSRLAIVLVGDAAKFVPQLKKAGFESYELVKLEELDLTAVNLKRVPRAAAGAPGTSPPAR